MKILVTGGAGFIGSNLVESLLKDERIELVRVLDNLATGSLKNIQPFFTNPKFEFIEGDIREYSVCLSVCKNIDIISHQAALGSVPRSISDPITTNSVNIDGTLNIFNAAKESGINKIIYAASSSTYGDSISLPKIENIIGKPLSPYAITKYVNELYADVFQSLYKINFIGLRYFNVFGPKQNPSGPYAAVIPLFINSLRENSSPFINGNGEQSRDFTFVDNAVDANLKALFCTEENAWNQVYNIAFGERTTINELFRILITISGSEINAIHREERVGDIPHSLASIEKAKKLLNYNPKFSVMDGLDLTWKWFIENPEHFN